MAKNQPVPSGINPYYLNVEKVRQAGELLPVDYQPIDDEWLEKHEEAINLLRSTFAEKGGVHLLEVGEFRIICRAPSRDIMNQSTEKAQSSKRIEADMHFVGQCMLYPQPALLGRWMDEHVGLASAFAAKLLEIAKLTQEAVAKKL